MTETNTLTAQLKELIGPVLTENGLFLYDLEVQPGDSNGTVRLIVERAGEFEPGDGVTIGQVAEISREVGYLLDIEDPIPFAYRLEVSSPGVERLLRTEEHFVRNEGVDARVVLRRPTDDGRVVLEGQIVPCDESGRASIHCLDDVVRRFDVSDIKRGHTRHDFGGRKPGKPKGGKKKARKS